jgi:hypothetical protein
VFSHVIFICPKLLTYLSVVKPLLMKFDQLLVSELASRVLDFESDLSSAAEHRNPRYTQLTSYFCIVKSLLMKFSQLLVSEQVSTTSPSHLRILPTPLNGVHHSLNFHGKSHTGQRARAVPNQIRKPIDALYFIPLSFLAVISTF